MMKVMVQRLGGDASPSFTAASPGESGSSAADPNAYEIDEHDNVVSKSSDYFQLGIICIVALLLLLVGYKRQKDKEEEEQLKIFVYNGVFAKKYQFFKLHNFQIITSKFIIFLANAFLFNFLILKLKDKVLFFNFKINRLL